MRRTGLILIALSAATVLGGCALWPGRAAPEPVVLPPEPPAAIPEPDTDRGLPVCPGDPRCKKPG